MEEKENVSEEMESILAVEEVKDSGLTQLKYLFSSWTKYFNSVKNSPRYLIFIVAILVFIFMKLPFKGAELEAVIEETRVLLEEQIYGSSIYAGMGDAELESIVEMSLNATKNMYKTPIYLIISIVSLFFSVLVSSLFYFVLAKIFKSSVTYKKMFSAMLGHGVLSSINGLIYSLSVFATGSLISITSLGVFFMEANTQDLSYVLATSINIFTVISGIFVYFMCLNLLELSKKKSIIFTIIIIVVPILFMIGQVALSNAMMNAFM